MAELGGMLAAAILKVVGDQIGSAIGGQIKLQENFDADLKKMKMALESVEAVLKAAERQSITDEPTRLWLKRLTDAMYDISSMIDESERKLSLKKRFLRFVSCLPLGPKITMANQMKVMRDELKEITDNHQNFTFIAGTSAVQLGVKDIRETSSTMGDKEHIVGRTDETAKILACLSESMENKFIVLPIYGIGGIGKTTLGKIVFSNSQFRDYSQVWIYVSQAFDLKKIGNSVISQLSKEESRYTDMQMIHNSLRELLSYKKILIVLDDLWEDNKSQLDELMNMLNAGESGNVVVIVTTRSEDIAIKISTIQPHKLESLTYEMCWTIIKQKSAFELRNDQGELEQIGKDIARKCGGVALAAHSLGHMLHSLTFNEWESIRNSDIWNVSDSEDTSLTDVLASLRLTYSVMPSNLKLCFAYCAIFPKGYNIVKDDLIRQWISLGFIKATSMLSSWQLGEKYIRQLLGLSFLDYSKSTLTTEVDFENNTMFSMHDLVHDLARSVMVDEILVASKQGNTGGSSCHFALLNDCAKPLESPKIRALRFMECGDIELHGAAFSSSRSMRVLDLSDCSIHKLPDSIGVLKQLRYLNAPRVQDVIIPNSITRLSKLLYLNLHGSSSILTLPESIGEIEGLAYLDLSGCSKIKKLPESFRRLNELVHLDFSHCSCVGGISAFLARLTQLKYLNLSYCPKIGVLPEALGGLSKLQYLNLSFSSYLECCQEVEVLGNLTKLEYLNLASQECDLEKLPEALGIFIQLKYLNLSGCKKMTKLPRLFGKHLVHLDLSHCVMVDRLHEALVGLTSLQHLNLDNTDICSLPEDLTKLRYLNLCERRSYRGLSSLVEHISNSFFDLEHLDLSGNTFFKIPESICNLRKLHTLDLSRCRYLTEIPKSLATVDSLKFLILNGSTGISKPPQLSSGAVTLPHFVVQPGYGDSGSNIVQLQSTDPVELQISKLENVKSVAEAHRTKLLGKQKLEDLKLEWTEDVERFMDDRILLENLVPPSTLKKLEICGYNGTSFPSWVVGQLPNLEKLFLTNMANLKFWVVCQLPNLNELVLRGMANLESLVFRDMAKLKSVVLRDMENLEEWDTSYSSGDESVIENLIIHDCPKLRMKPLPPRAKSWEISNSDNMLSSWEECTASHTNASSSSSLMTIKLSVKDCNVPINQWRLLQHLSGPIISLFISSCGDLTGSSETRQYLSSVKKLHLEYEDLEELPEWIGELTSLQKLKINECRRLKGLQGNMRQLIKLQSLKLEGCENMASLPHWLGELTSLKTLVIVSCDVLRSLPESIQRLTSLQHLNISRCPELQHFVELEEGKMDLNHNQEKVCVLPISLENLWISHCEGIKSLPDGIQQLTNLEHLSIIGCPELKQWCELEENQMKLVHIKEKGIHEGF